MTNSGNNPRTRDDPRSELLSRAYRDSVEHGAAEPPRSIDDAIRTAAHQAVEASPRIIESAAARAILRRWRTPLALAATLLLAVGIAFRIYKSGEMGIALRQPPAKDSTIQQVVPDKSEPANAQPEITEERQPNKTAAAPPSFRKQPAAPETDTAKNTGMGRNKTAPSTPPAEYNLRVEPGTGEALQSQTPQEDAQPMARPFPGVPGAVQPTVPARDSATAPRSTAPSQKSYVPALDSLSRSRTERTQEEKTTAAPESEVQLLAKRLDGRPPEVWVEEIRILKHTGRSAESTELLATFRKKFPNFTLPDDLK